MPPPHFRRHRQSGDAPPLQLIFERLAGAASVTIYGAVVKALLSPGHQTPASPVQIIA